MLPPRPKNMHHKTYDRLSNEIREALSEIERLLDLEKATLWRRYLKIKHKGKMTDQRAQSVSNQKCECQKYSSETSVSGRS